MTNIPQMFPIGLLLELAGQFAMWFLLFWAYLPFALAALELSELTKRFA